MKRKFWDSRILHRIQPNPFLLGLLHESRRHTRRLVFSLSQSTSDKLSGCGFDELVWFALGASFESLQRYRGKTRRRGLADW